MNNIFKISLLYSIAFLSNNLFTAEKLDDKKSAAEVKVSEEDAKFIADAKAEIDDIIEHIFEDSNYFEGLTGITSYTTEEVKTLLTAEDNDITQRYNELSADSPIAQELNQYIFGRLTYYFQNIAKEKRRIIYKRMAEVNQELEEEEQEAEAAQDSETI